MAATQILERERARLRAAGLTAPQAQVLGPFADPVPSICPTPAKNLANCCKTCWREPQQPAQAPALPLRQELAPPRAPPGSAALPVAAAASASRTVGAGASAQAPAAAGGLPAQAAADSRPCQPPTHAGDVVEQPATQHAPGVDTAQASPPRRAPEGSACARPDLGHRNSAGGGSWGGFSGGILVGNSGDGGRRPAGL